MNDKLYKLFLKPVMQAIKEGYFNLKEYNDFADFVYCIHEGDVDLTRQIIDKMEKDIDNRLSL